MANGLTEAIERVRRAIGENECREEALHEEWSRLEDIAEEVGDLDALAVSYAERWIKGGRPAPIGSSQPDLSGCGGVF